MTFTKELLHQILDQTRTPNERARLRCRLAQQYEESGNYRAARDAMGDLWHGFGALPNVEGLDRSSTGEVLLRIGAITGWLGSTKQIEGAQESAKNLISQSIAVFEALGEVKRMAEARSEIAVCYGREGALDNARAMLSEALSQLNEQDGDLLALALLRSAIVEKLANRLSDALHILRRAGALFETSNNHTLRGRFHHELANVLRRLSEIESRTHYSDKALIEYSAASFHFEQAGHDRYQACVENNLALLLFKLDRFEEAYQHLERAETLFTTLNDVVHLAQVAETRARVMLAEGAIVQAERSARRAVQLLENGDEKSLLAEALTRHGIALAQLQHKDQARAAFERAIREAEQVDDWESAGLAALALAEAIPERLSDEELFTALKSADDRLDSTQNAALLQRQKNCFRGLALRILWPDWPIALEDSAHQHEARQILRALEDTGGVIRRAARLLELTPQGLQKILSNRHKDLRAQIAAIKVRNREDAVSEDVSGVAGQYEIRENLTARILHVEDDETIAALAREMFEEQGWAVETCVNGSAALQKISGGTDYDLLLVDYKLPNVNGIELVLHARKLTHRSQIPIIMLSATPVEAEAREAGADAFLQKPQDVTSLVETVARLLAERDQTNRVT